MNIFNTATTTAVSIASIGVSLSWDQMAIHLWNGGRYGGFGQLDSYDNSGDLRRSPIEGIFGNQQLRSIAD
jgi:hypothetical protein